MLPKPKKRWTPSLWASWKPFGIGEQYPNNYWEVRKKDLYQAFSVLNHFYYLFAT
ncbi:molybdopterin-dependent oxidoreductase alpha subunit [Tolypothrix sp. NIES-4075]|nr:molybdopterin-dependent oxidoreductase alpha subunit [Tolypothrix sp. NIES-4075]